MSDTSTGFDKVRKWLASLIKTRKLSVSTLAGAIGKSDSWLRKILYGKITSISPEVATQLAIAIGVEPRDILRDAWSLSDKEIERLIESTRGTVKQLSTTTTLNKLSPTILSVLSDLQNPNTGMLEFLQNIEELTGFPLSKESCISLLKDWQAAHPSD